MGWREKRRILRFLYNAYFDNKRQSENRDDEIAFQLKRPIERQRLIIYLKEFEIKGLIERDRKRTDAYRITDKGIVYCSGGLSSSVANMPMQKKIIIILMIIGVITTWLLFILS